MSDWPFITRNDYDRFLTAIVETDGEGRIADYRIDIGVGVVRVHIRHCLGNLFRPTRREGIAVVLHEAIERGRSVAVNVQVVASYVPLWMRRRLAPLDVDVVERLMRQKGPNP